MADADNRGVNEEVFSAPEVAKAATDATIALLAWVGYQREVLSSARESLLKMDNTPDMRNIVARIDLALEGKRARP